MGKVTPYKPSEEEKKKAINELTALKSFGIINEEIANYLGISVDTLTRNYSRELSIARTKANAEVAQHLFRKATKGEDVTAMIFWLKTQGRWRSEDSKAITSTNEDLTREIKELREKLDKEYRREY